MEMDNKCCGFYPASENEITYEQNHKKCEPKVCYYPDPINVYNVDGEHIGYS